MVENIKLHWRQFDQAAGSPYLVPLHINLQISNQQSRSGIFKHFNLIYTKGLEKMLEYNFLWCCKIFNMNDDFLFHVGYLPTSHHKKAAALISQSRHVIVWARQEGYCTTAFFLCRRAAGFCFVIILRPSSRRNLAGKWRIAKLSSYADCLPIHCLFKRSLLHGGSLRGPPIPPASGRRQYEGKENGGLEICFKTAVRVKL